ncbi:MAG TPA: chitinase, partial [Colwellia sp.]|nr:chitinase [Colwellia sp.]
MMRFLTTSITVIALTLATTQAIAAVGTPGFTSEVQAYSYVSIDTEGTGSYKQLVQLNEKIDINIGWTMWTGLASTYEVYFDDTLVNSGNLSSGTSGNISFPYTGKAGTYELTLKFCDDSSCKKSTVKELIIADTDGAHLSPLTMTTDTNNNTYAKTDSVVGAYFVEWGVYGRDFDVSDIPADNLTHLLYGFIPICGSNASLTGSSVGALTTACADSEDYEVVVHDPWAALQMSFDGLSYGDPIKGIYSQLMRLKQRNPDLKILPSIGGWTLSDPFFDFTDKANRDVFVTSVGKFLRTWKFYDGVDIDWEFPGGGGANSALGNTENDGDAYVALMKEIRAMLDVLEAETGREYELTSAIGVGADKIEDVNYGAAQVYMDYIFNMSYDFYGAWSGVTGHQTGLYCGSSISTEQCTGTGIEGDDYKYPAYTTVAGVDALLAQGVEPSKIVVGAAMYGRSWIGAMPADAINDNPMTITNAAGPLTGSTSQGIWEAGVIDYKGIYANMIGASGTGINGWETGYDEVAEAAYVWNRTTGGLISYDNARSIKAKGQYVQDLGLAGLFAWEIDGDNGDILNAMRDSLPIGTS